MRTVAKYIKAVICVLIVIAALVAPVTGFAPGRGSVTTLKNEIDQSSLSPDWTNGVLDFSNAIDNQQDDSMARAVWDFARSTDIAVYADAQEAQTSLADVLRPDSDSGYDKLVEMARGGYADLGTKVVSVAKVSSSAVQSNLTDNFGQSWPSSGRDNDSSSNGYIDTPANPTDPGVTPADPGGGTTPTDPTDPTNPTDPVDPTPVVPAPPAIVLAFLGAVFVSRIKKLIG